MILSMSKKTPGHSAQEINRQSSLRSIEIQRKHTTERPSVQLVVEITRFIRETLLVEVASPEDDLLATGVLDSLTLIQLLVHLEEQFSLKISLDELEIDDLRSINSITRLVQSRPHAAHVVTAE
jgi:methoxymalonate biosynthesis acyl carrier protein